MAVNFPDWGPERWKDLPENPLIGPPHGDVVGDPQVLLPGEHDDMWHMFAHGKGYIYHFVSTDGVRWELAGEWNWEASPCFLMRWEEGWLLFYGRVEGIGGTAVVSIVVRTSEDLVNWSDPAELLRPELDWELEGPSRWREVRNPCVVRISAGSFRLYYSGGTVLLEDTGYEEPKYISFATAPSPLGPYRKLGYPIIGPSPDVPYRNLGAGAIKVYRRGDIYIGFNNGIYRDEEGRSRSAICLVGSEDGIRWEDAPFNPIIPPTKSWKGAFVYQLDAKFVKEDGKEKILLYYNARDGWRGGIERIGCSAARFTRIPLQNSGGTG